MQEFGGDEYILKWSDVPACRVVTAEDVGEPYSADDFPFRQAANAVSMGNVFDVLKGFAEPVDEHNIIDNIIKWESERNTQGP